MDRRTKASLNRDKAVRLNESWRVGAVQARYSDDGHWYAAVNRFPAALFDATGYVRFATEEDYRTSPHIRIGKQISVPKPGISAIPNYVRMLDNHPPRLGDIDIHGLGANEGDRQLVVHLVRERNQALARRKKKLAASLCCEACASSTLTGNWPQSTAKSIILYRWPRRNGRNEPSYKISLSFVPIATA